MEFELKPFVHDMDKHDFCDFGNLFFDKVQPKQIQIRYDENEHAIYVGSLKCPLYQGKIFNTTSFCLNVLSQNYPYLKEGFSEGNFHDAVVFSNFKKPNFKFYNPNENFMRTRNRVIGNYLGVSMKQFALHFDKLSYKVFVAPIRDVLSMFPQPNGKLDGLQFIINKLNKNLEIINQLRKDNLIHLAPICGILGKTPEDMKQSLGKGLWKQVCKQPKTRIGLIGYNLARHGHNIKDEPQYIAQLVKSRTTMLKSTYCSTYNINVALWMQDNCIMSNSKELRTMFDLYCDTKQLADLVDEKFTPELWDKSQLEQKHDEFTLKRSRMFRKNQTRPFDLYSDFCDVIKDIKSDKYDIHVFQNGGEVEEEGDMQRHCIGMYANSMYAGDCLLVSLREKCGKIYSSVMFSRGRDGEWKMIQHYKKFNQTVDCEEAKLIAGKIKTQLNLRMTDGQN